MDTTDDSEMICFFDLYIALYNETIDILRDPDLQRLLARAQGIDSLRELLEVAPGSLYRLRDIPYEMRYLGQQLKKVRPYVLALPVVQLVLDIASQQRVVPYAPFLSLPAWIELDGASVGDEETQFVAILAMQDPERPELTQIQLLTPNMQQTKRIFLYPEGRWEYEQTGTCVSKNCPVASYTREGEPYRMKTSDVRGWPDCTCAQAGLVWMNLINTINQLLLHRKQPVEAEMLEREVPQPYAAPRTRREKEANTDARRRSRPNIVNISLSAPVRIVARRSGSGTAEHAQLEWEEDKISVEAHYRVLIPGEGKPWKALKIVPISSYERRQKPGQPIYRRVEL